MTISIKLLPIGHFIKVKDYQCPPYTEDSFRLYALVSSSGNTTFHDIAALSTSDKANARATFIKLHKKAVIGLPLKQLFDAKQYHSPFELHYKGQKIEILRIRLAGDVRVYFMYLNKRRIVVLKTLVKREDDLSEGEQKKLTVIAKQVFDCLQAGKIHTLGD